jgi:DNA-binding NtrC family response regulator
MTEKLPRVLIVDDEPDMCWALQRILDPSEFAVTVTTRGAEALALLETTSFALAFVDAKIPDLDGMELAGLIRKRSPRTRIVLISGYFYQEDPAITEGLHNQVFIGFIAKPFDIQDVRTIARRAVQMSQEG